MEKSKFNCALIFRWVAIFMSLYHLGTCIFGIPASQLHRALHLMLACVLTFGGFNFKGKKSDGRCRLTDWILIAATVFSMGYIVVENKVLENRLAFVTPFTTVQLVAVIMLVVLVLEATRRLTGLTLPIACLIFLAYAFWGDRFTGVLGHAPLSAKRILEQISITSEGIFGSSLGISATYVVIFIILAGFLETTGAGQFFIDIASSATGTKRGGPAKIAVVGSCLFGSISGSSVANVVSTGTFTIPLSKSVGYPSYFAGAVEAVSSTGGQLMPPVMGAAAFLMAEATAIPYGTICLAALVPALMYYICIFSTVDVESLKANLTGMDLKDIPKLLPVLKKSAKLLLPIAVLILSLCVFGFSTSRSALYSMAVLIICCCFDKDDRFSLKKLVNALRSGAIGSTTVITATAICGIIISMLTMTGLGVKFSSLLISLGSSSLLISLLLAMLVCIVLGMGLPTAAAYIIASSTIATALIKLGVPVLGAHMFLFYFSSIACITPPVALASYAAAGICKAPPMKVSMEAVKIGIVAFLVPYAFIYNPSILTYDFSSPYMILDTIVTFVCCVVDALPISYVVQGYHYRPIRLYERALFLVIAIGLIWPGVVVPLISLAVFLLFWLPARAKYYKENPKLPTPAAN